MFRELLEKVRAEASGERALETVRAISRFHRVQASPGYDEAAAWVEARLRSFGLEVEVERAPADGRTRCLGHVMPEGWACERAVATLVDGGGARERLCDYDAEKLSLVLRSAPARGTYPIVAVTGGADDADYEGIDVRGAVVLTAAPVHRALDLAVHARGAAGLLTDGRRLVPPVRDAFTDVDALAYTSFWWAGDQPRGWGFVVSPRLAARLRDRLRAGERLRLEVEIESRRFATEIPLVSAIVPGRGAGEVLVVSHLCHPQPSANDNASGAAALLETARVLGRLRATGAHGEGARTIRLLWMPEFHGTYAWLARDASRAGRIVAALNLDMVGQNQEACGSTFMLERPPHFAGSFAESLLARIRRRALDWIGGYEQVVSPTRTADVPYAGGSDHICFTDPAIGVPCPLLIQWPDRFYHSSHDTPDRTDPASLALAVRCAATYAAAVARAGAAETPWLADAVARDARVRALAEADAPGARAAVVARERAWLASALASLARLGAADGVAARLAAFDAELGAAAGSAEGREGGDRRVPVRGQRSPVEHLRHLGAGWEALDPPGRAGLLAFDAAASRLGHGPLLEVAWFAADGRRTVDDIRRVVRLEAAGRPLGEPDVAGFFEWTTRLGISTWA
jgi:aminopeptidase YwaD